MRSTVVHRIEIGYKPGVTDSRGLGAAESIRNSLGLPVHEVRTRRGKQVRIETSHEDPGGRGSWMRRTTWVDAHDFLVRRIEVEGARPEGGGLLRYHRSHRYWGYEADPDISDDLFRFTPPMGTRIQHLQPL